MQKDLLKLLDLSKEDILNILNTADQLKYNQKHGIVHDYLHGKTLAMIFEKNSTRTRVSFETGMFQLGGHALFLSGKESQIGRGEPVEDTARVLDRYCDIGIATDGDADRLGVIDDKGHYLHANQILVMLYYYLLKYKGWRGDAVRNLATTHMLDKVAESFGQKCYEVPVGFKYISAKMQETDAIIGGESSGGLTVKGHIHGKDGIYAASLLVEMIAVTGKSLSEIVKDIEDQYGETHMEERSYRFTAEEKARIQKVLLEEQKLPELPFEVSRVSYQDGCKVYFKNGGWVSARFSGTEPLLRILCEMEKEEDAVRACVVFERFLGL